MKKLQKLTSLKKSVFTDQIILGMINSLVNKERDDDEHKCRVSCHTYSYDENDKECDHTLTYKDDNLKTTGKKVVNDCE